MSAYAEDRKTLAFRLGESLSDMTDHLLLMTATPHKGDPANFRLFLSLLDKDVYGSIESLEHAMRQQNAPFYLRRIKEALVSFPDPDTGEVRKLFTKRTVHTAAFDLDGEELEFYDELTRYVEDQSILASADNSARGRAVGFTMAMLQRRMASTIYAVRRSLERMRNRREKILAELASDDSDVRAEYLKLFKADAQEFSTSMAQAFMKWRALDADVQGNGNRAYISSLVFTAIGIHILSLKLFLSGHIVAAGNIFRQVVEFIALAFLCSSKELGILEKFMNDRYSTNNAVRDVLRHSEKLGLTRISQTTGCIGAENLG